MQPKPIFDKKALLRRAAAARHSPMKNRGNNYHDNAEA
jgi:hypothetical protein